MDPNQTNFSSEIPEATIQDKPSKVYGHKALTTFIIGLVLAIAYPAVPLGIFLLPLIYVFVVPAFFIFAILWAYHSLRDTPTPVIYDQKTISEEVETTTYKKHFIISLLFALPGPLIALFLQLGARSGQSGTEFLGLFFSAVFIVSFVALVAAFIYGIAFIIKSKNMFARLIVFLGVIGLGILSAFSLLQSL